MRLLLITIITLFALEASAQDKSDVLPSGTLIPITFTHTVCSNSNHQITAFVSRDIYGDSGRVVIRGGEVVKIQIERQKARGFGRSGWVQVTTTSVTAVDGSEIMLNGNDRVEGENAKGKAWLIAGCGFILLPPVGILGGFFVKGEDVCIDQIPIVKVVSTTEIKTRK